MSVELAQVRAGVEGERGERAGGVRHLVISRIWTHESLLRLPNQPNEEETTKLTHSLYHIHPSTQPLCLCCFNDDPMQLDDIALHVPLEEKKEQKPPIGSIPDCNYMYKNQTPFR